MTIRSITGIIDRRLLINYQIDPEALTNLLPAPFRPQIIKGKGMGGICLIRLKNMRIKGFPDLVGFNSENGAHRIAVEWQEGDKLTQGVYIPRRDTSSKLNSWIGGHFFPGVHSLANFTTHQEEDRYSVSFESKDKTAVSVKAKITNQWSSNSLFGSLTEASAFF